MSRAPHQLFDLSGRSILITGAAGHLGRSISETLAGAGANVYLNGRSTATISKLVDDIGEAGGHATPAVFDITDEQRLADFLSAHEDVPFSGIVNNAYAGGAGNTEVSTSADFLGAYTVNVVAPHNLLRSLLPSFDRAIANGVPVSVVNIASMYGVVSPDLSVYDPPSSANPPFYAAAKAALIHWTRYLACELGPAGIRVNAISPGPFPSPEVLERDPRFVARLEAKVPLGRVGRPEELASAALYLMSEASSYVNGHNLVVDGGWTSW